MNRIPMIFHIVFHTLGVLTVAGLSFVLTAGFNTESLLTPRPSFDFHWMKLAIQFGLAACVWALGYITYCFGKIAVQRRSTVAIKRATGTAMTEFLIVLVPYLLLTSGLAQLAQLNITSMLADVAIYDAARTVWIWAPEMDTARQGRASDAGALDTAGTNGNGAADMVSLASRGRTVASAVLAPTAPGDYVVFQSVPSPYAQSDSRSVLSGMFELGNNATTNWEYTSFADVTFTTGTFSDFGGASGIGGPQGVGNDVRYDKSFDTTTFQRRGGRKMTFAQYCMWSDAGPGSFNPIVGAQVGAEFTYMYNIVFPWFGYIWGQRSVVAGRDGWYSPIRRRHTFTAHPDLS